MKATEVIASVALVLALVPFKMFPIDMYIQNSVGSALMKCGLAPTRINFKACNLGLGIFGVKPSS